MNIPVWRCVATTISIATLASCAPSTSTSTSAAHNRRFEVTVVPSAHAGALTGRLIVIVSKENNPEPRYRFSHRGGALFGVDLNQLTPGQTTVVDDSAIGYPAPLAELPEGDYYLQAIVNVYTQVRRADGHTIWVHLNDGMVETSSDAAGNLYSDVQKVHIGKDGTFRIAVNHVNPPLPRAVDTEFLKHVRIQSQKLTQFWGHPIFINAVVLLPRGYADHPNVYYPTVYPLGHGNAPFSFNPTPDSAPSNSGELNPIELRRGATVGVNSGLESGHDFYKSWIADGFPRFIAITLQQQTPYFPDSYSVNSANNGPYGDAVVDEMIPYLEEHFRIIRKPYARHIEGASTSGWQTLALQLQHPDFFGNAWVLQPDPIDFRHYQLSDIYTDSNAFSVSTGQLTSSERYFQRAVTGQPLYSTRERSLLEEVLGSHGRSENQFNAWEAVYGPVTADGYPAPLWDKRTGKIDHNVATYMRDHGYDLLYYTQKNWATLGPKLVGKLHFFCGDMDNYYLDLAVYSFEDFLKKSTNPHVDADFTYGRPMKGHGWHSFTWAEMVQKMAAATKVHAPSGENVSSWNY